LTGLLFLLVYFVYNFLFAIVQKTKVAMGHVLGDINHSYHVVTNFS